MFLNDNNTRWFRVDLGPSYGSTLVKRCFWKEENPYSNLRVHTWPWAYIHILDSYVHDHKPMYATRVLETPIRQAFYKILVEAIPHHLESPPSLLFEHYKRSFSNDIQNLLQKKLIKGNGQNQPLKSFLFEVLVLALISLFVCFYSYFLLYWLSM